MMTIKAVERRGLTDRLVRALRRNPIVTLIGARQCGKSTLARAVTGLRVDQAFDLENPVDIARLSEPATTLTPLRGLVVLDEI